MTFSGIRFDVEEEGVIYVLYREFFFHVLSLRDVSVSANPYRLVSSPMTRDFRARNDARPSWETARRVRAHVDPGGWDTDVSDSYLSAGPWIPSDDEWRDVT